MPLYSFTLKPLQSVRALITFIITGKRCIQRAGMRSCYVSSWSKLMASGSKCISSSSFNSQTATLVLGIFA